LAYVFDYVNNTLIDDEDKSLGNKFAVLDPELEKVLQELNEKFGPGTIQEGTQGIPPPPVKTPQAIFEFEERMKGRMADGGKVRQNFAAAGLALPALSYPASFGLAKIFGLSTAGVGATELGNKVTDYIQNNPNVLNDPRFKAVALTFGINLPGYIAPDADEMEREKEKIREMTKPTGFPAETEKMPIKTGETTPPEIDTKESFPAGENIKPVVEGFPADTEQLPIIFEKKDYGKKALEDLNPKTVTDVNKIVEDYRASKIRPAGPVTFVEKSGRVRTREMPASTQPRFKEEDKLELLNLVIDAYEKRENKKPSATELKTFIPFFNADSLAKKYNIKLGKRIAAYDRKDPAFITTQKENKQLKANEDNTITSYEEEFFFPKTITLKNGDVVDGKKFFIDNLTKKVESGPGRKETLAITLKNKDLAELYNTNISKIDKASKAIRNDPNFKADYPEPRTEGYYDKIARDRIKTARKYLKPNELTNVKLQEKHIKYVNDLFKDGTLVVTDFPNIVESINTTIDKKTGIIDRSIKKTDEEMIERSKESSGLFDVSHTIPKTSEQQNIEFLRNRNFADYKTNQGLFKSFEAYVKNQKEDPEYDLRLEEFDAYMKEMGQRVKIDNKFFGLDEAMIDSETGEFLGFNRQLEYYGLPKMESGVSLTKIKKASGGGVKITPLPRSNFGNGGAAGADVDFATELEYFFTNPDTEIPEITTYKETSNPIEIFNDIIDPRNYPYYADVLVRSGLRIGEFGARVLPATGKLISDAMQKGVFKIRDNPDSRYVQDYDEILPSNIRGTGIFSEFLQNITPTTLEKKVGLDKLIKAEEKKQIERGSTAGPKVFADTIGLGAEVTAPIFPGLKLLRAFAKNRNLPVNNVTKKLLIKEVDEVLEQRGMNRRDFLKVTGAGATVILAKMLGFGDEVAKTAKVAEKAAEVSSGAAPTYFFDLVEIIKKKGIDVTKKEATQNLQNVYKYKGYEVYEDLATGQIRIEKSYSIRADDDALQVLEYKPGQADETTKGKPADDYEEVTEVKYGDPTDMDRPIQEIEDGVDLDAILEFIKNEKIN
jgi:hypothetical protein